jgi:DNA polymerase I
MDCLPYREVWAVDFEFSAPPGERPEPACLVAWELNGGGGQKIRLWRDKFGPLPPYPLDEGSLFVSYFASAEMNCHRSLGWPMPARVLDLFTEFRDLTNGCHGLNGEFQKASIIDALEYFGLGHIAVAEKAEMRQRFMAGNFDTWSESEKQAGLDYCETDVVALAELLPRMAPKIDLRAALIRGRYSGPAVSFMEHEGVPIDVELLKLATDSWEAIKGELISGIDKKYGVYEDGHFREKRFAEFLSDHKISWERTAPTKHAQNGHLKLDDETFKQMAKSFKILDGLRDLRHALGTMRLNNLAVGRDGRNRTLLSQFAARTGRNQPSSAKFIFGPGVWMRGFIKPPEGYALAYIDWTAAEFGIAAKQSGDEAMMAIYRTGDPHLAFAKEVGAVPDWATKESHETERNRYKACNFGILYGMGIQALARRISGETNDPEGLAAQILADHKRIFKQYWQWNELTKDHANLFGWLRTMWGWHVRTSKGVEPNPRSMGNFLVQGGCAEIMRAAACLATERGVPVCCPVHDAFLVCSPIERFEDDVKQMQACMAEASRLALGGFELFSDVKRVFYPNRYMDKRGKEMWETVTEILEAQYGQKIV